MPDETEKARAATPRKPTEQYVWQKARLTTPGKKAPAGAILTRGYGADGSYSLYLPTANAKRSIEFRNGKPVVVTADSCLTIPAVRETREWLLRCAARAVPLAEIVADVALVQYSAALLAVNYRLSDDDLAFLHSGGMWREPIIKHALGGDGAITALRAIRPERIREIAAQAAGGLADADWASAPLPIETGTAVAPVEIADPETVAAVAAIVAARETLDDERPEQFDPTDL